MVCGIKKENQSVFIFNLFACPMGSKNILFLNKEYNFVIYYKEKNSKVILGYYVFVTYVRTAN